jgi:hypothetical protein
MITLSPKKFSKDYGPCEKSSTSSGAYIQKNKKERQRIKRHSPSLKKIQKERRKSYNKGSSLSIHHIHTCTS